MTGLQTSEAKVSPSLQDEWNRLSDLTDEQLDQELSSALEMNARNLVKLALIVRQKEDRGHDLSEMKIGMLSYLRKIAYGQLLPEVLAQFGSHPTLLRRVASLPLPDQQRCVDGKGVRVACWEGDELTHRLVKPTQMSRTEIRLVFASDHLRDPQEQAAWAKGQSASLPVSRAPNPVQVDKKAGVIIVTGQNVRITREQLLMYLASLG